MPCSDMRNKLEAVDFSTHLPLTFYFSDDLNLTTSRQHYGIKAKHYTAVMYKEKRTFR